MEEETSEAGGDDGVTDQEVPVYPLPLDPAESGKVCASVKLLGGIFVKNGGGGGSRVEGHEGGREKGVRWKRQLALVSVGSIGPL